MQRLALNSSNKAAGSPLVMMSASCRWVGICSTLNWPRATLSLTKCMSISTCLGLRNFVYLLHLLSQSQIWLVASVGLRNNFWDCSHQINWYCLWTDHRTSPEFVAFNDVWTDRVQRVKCFHQKLFVGSRFHYKLFVLFVFGPVLSWIFDAFSAFPCW